MLERAGPFYKVIRRSQSHRLACDRMISSCWRPGLWGSRIQTHSSGEGTHRAVTQEPDARRPTAQGAATGPTAQSPRLGPGSQGEGVLGPQQALGSWGAPSRSPDGPCGERGPVGRGWGCRGLGCSPGCWGGSHRRSLGCWGPPREREERVPEQPLRDLVVETGIS